MGNTMSCFDRWGKRTPDGALFASKRKSDAAAKSPSAFDAANSSSSKAVGALGAASSSVAKAKSGAAPGERPLRRRQTYSSKTERGETDMSSFDEEEGFSDSLDDEEVTTSDVRQRKLAAYRRDLMKVVKLKTHMLSATVKVTCSKDGREIEWYRGQSGGDGKHKPAGAVPTDKIVSVKSQADNPRVLVLTAANPTPQAISFTFKTKEERETWQEQLESFMKFMAMR